MPTLLPPCTTFSSWLRCPKLLAAAGSIFSGSDWHCHIPQRPIRKLVDYCFSPHVLRASLVVELALAGHRHIIETWSMLQTCQNLRRRAPPGVVCRVQRAVGSARFCRDRRWLVGLRRYAVRQCACGQGKRRGTLGTAAPLAALDTAKRSYAWLPSLQTLRTCSYMTCTRVRWCRWPTLVRAPKG